MYNRTLGSPLVEGLIFKKLTVYFLPKMNIKPVIYMVIYDMCMEDCVDTSHTHNEPLGSEQDISI